MTKKAPSVEGNEVIFYDAQHDLKGFEGLYGSIELDSKRASLTGKKIFRNRYRQIYKIEKFDPVFVGI